MGATPSSKPGASSAARKMTGQIIQKGDKKWLVRAFVGRNAEGKRMYVSELVRGGKKDADKKLTELLKSKNDGKLRVRPKSTVDQYLDLWLETTVQPSVRQRTFDDYTAVLKTYVRPYLGGLRISALSPIEIRAMLVKLRDKGLGPRTVRKAHEVLRNALEQAVSDNLIPDNPARTRLVSKALPQKIQAEPEVIKGDQVGAFVEAAAGHRLSAYFILSLFSGLRPSEALALRWTDLSGSTISVTRALVDQGRGKPLHYAPPKSKTSRRAVVVPDIVVRALAEHRKRQAAERLKAGEYWQGGDLVFCNEVGEPLRQGQVRTAFTKIRIAAKLPDNIRPYGLRHSCATLLLEEGVPLKIVSERLGHSTIALTADTYSHVTPSMQQQAADALGKVADAASRA
jgi:integrase